LHSTKEDKKVEIANELYWMKKSTVCTLRIGLEEALGIISDGQLENAVFRKTAFVFQI
jgi:hypothetical protein